MSSIIKSTRTNRSLLTPFTALRPVPLLCLPRSAFLYTPTRCPQAFLLVPVHLSNPAYPQTCFHFSPALQSPGFSPLAPRSPISHYQYHHLCSQSLAHHLLLFLLMLPCIAHVKTLPVPAHLPVYPPICLKALHGPLIVFTAPACLCVRILVHCFI